MYCPDCKKEVAPYGQMIGSVQIEGRTAPAFIRYTCPCCARLLLKHPWAEAIYTQLTPGLKRPWIESEDMEDE